MAKERVIIIGIDGAPYRLIRQLAESGAMPIIKDLIDEGVFRRMSSSLPEISSVAWSSIITGANPGLHGVFGFTDLAPGTYRRVFPNFNSLKTKPFWEREGAGRSVVINVPMTYPARAFDGALIAGFVALDLERATYPQSLVPKLNDMNYRVDVDAGRAAESISYFLADLDRTLEARIAAYRYLWHEIQDWSTFVFVFTGADRLSHYLWHAYEDPAHPYHDSFVEHFSRIDRVIGEIVDRTSESDALLLLSDHGFELLNHEVEVNLALRRWGYLGFEQEQPNSLKELADGSRAFALDPGRIYLNYRGKYPKGIVSAADRAPLLEDLKARFLALEVEGRKIVSRIYHKEEIYSGPYVERAPDLVLLANEGVNLRASLKATELVGRDLRTGKHTYPDAFVIVKGKNADEIVPAQPTVTDIVGVIDGLR